MATSIANPRKIRLFTEPSRNKETFDEFLNYTSQTNIWVAKELIKDYSWNYPEKNFTLVRLRRKNVTEQITSMYISIVRDKWSYINENSYSYNSEVLPFDDEILETQIRYTLAQNDLCDQLENTCEIDYDLYYENIIDSFETVLSPTPKPANYEDLYNWVDRTHKETIK